jgi:hypothetical protein
MNMIAYCGITCTLCPAYLATQEDDNGARKEVASQWSDLLKTEILPEDINCDGCLSSSGRIFKHCSTCTIRRCNLERGIVNCAHCEEYPCSKLNRFLEQLGIPEIRKTLEAIRNKA